MYVQDCGNIVSILDLNNVHQLNPNAPDLEGKQGVSASPSRWDYRLPARLGHFAVDVSRNVLINLEIT